MSVGNGEHCASEVPMIDEKDVISQHIVSTPGVLGGKPRVAGHRIGVQDIAIWHERMGRSVMVTALRSSQEAPY
jgi:Protein of unknown function (DUF433)